MDITLITGAASGLGKEFAKLYAKDNNNLLLVDISKEGIENLISEIKEINKNIEVLQYNCDLSLVEELKNLQQFTIENKLNITNLVNCAGFGDRCDFEDMDIEKQIKMTELNCNSLLFLNKIVVDDMIKNKSGHIINVSSIAGFMPGPYMCTYHATKGFVLQLSESITYELKKYGIKVLTLCPGPFLSNFVKLAHNDYTFKKIKPMTAEVVAKKAYKASLKGKRLLITGVKNKLTVFILRLFPRSLITKVSAKSMKPGA